MGHVLGRVIVQAEDEESAFDMAEEALYMLAGEGKDYDSGRTLRDSDAYMRNEGEQPIIEACTKFGSDRCDKCKGRFKCYTRKTVDVVQVELDRMKEEFIKHMAELRQAIEVKTDEELFDDADFRCNCYDCGGHGYSSLLFDSDGSCIINKKELDSVMTPKDDQKVYIVAVDLHY